MSQRRGVIREANQRKEQSFEEYVDGQRRFAGEKCQESCFGRKFGLFAEQNSPDDGVARSQSHSSGLARMKAISGGSAKRFNEAENRSSLHENNIREEVGGGEEGKQDVG